MRLYLNKIISMNKNIFINKIVLNKIISINDILFE